MNILRNVALALLALAVPFAASPANAFGDSSYSYEVELTGETCSFYFNLDPNSRTAYVTTVRNGTPWRPVTPSIFSGGQILNHGAVDPSLLEEACNLTNVQIIAANGADGTFTDDVYMGVEFEGRSSVDGGTYRYQIGFGGSTQTYIINERQSVQPNDKPVAAAGPDRVAMPGDLIILDHTGSFDPDNSPSPLTVSWDVSIYPEIVPFLPPGETLWRFVVPDIAPYQSSSGFVTLTVSDGRYTDTDTFYLRIYSSNGTPTANAGPNQTVTSLTPVTLDGRASSSNDAAQPLTYSWRQLSGPSAVLSGSNTAQPTFEAPRIAPQATEEMVFELTVDDGFETATDTVSIILSGPPNTAPTADAGPDASATAGVALQLSALGSTDPDLGQTLTYNWTQVSGPAGTLVGDTTGTSSFTPPLVDVGSPPYSVVLQVEVSDGIDSTTDTVTLDVQAPPNTPPTAVAGPDMTEIPSRVVQVLGTDSTPNDPNQSLTYRWTQTSGPQVNFVINTANLAFVTPPVATGAPPLVLTFTLEVFDGFDWSAPDQVNVRVVAFSNTAPVADAGPDQTVTRLADVALDGSASYDPDPASGPLVFNWVQTSGPSVTLVNGNTATPSFVAPPVAPEAMAVLAFELRVLDDYAMSTDTMAITVTGGPNTPPTANAGLDQTGAAGGTVVLDGSGSSSNDFGQDLTYAWVQTGGPAASFDPTAIAPEVALPMLLPGANATLTFQLTVNDGVATSAPDLVEVLVTAPAELPPTGNAGLDQTVASGAAVVLDGTASSSNNAGQDLIFGWSQLSGPAVSLQGDTTAQPGFTAPTLAMGAADVTLVFRLVVDDGAASAQDLVTVTVTAPVNGMPTASAGPDQTVASGTTPALDSSGSLDPEGETLSYSWTQLSGPTVTLSDATAATPTFATPVLDFGDADVVLVFQLVVSDGVRLSPPDTVQITVTAPGAGQRAAALISGVPGSYSGSGSFAVAIAFSEPVTGFSADDIQVTNATVTGLTGGPLSYVATLAPTAYPEPITLSVPENVAFDLDAQGNTASAVATIEAGTSQATGEEIAEALVQRGRALINSQPQLRQFLLTGTINSFVASATADRSTLQLTLGKEGPVWIALQGEWSKTGEDQQDYVHLTFGSHLLRGDNLILGAMLQLDDARTTSATEASRGTGWLVGPYLIARAPNQPLVFSASVLTGATRNSLTRDGVGSDRFDTRRTLVTAGLEGRIVTASGLILTPSFDLSHVRDKQEAYVDAASVPVPAQTISLTEAAFGLGFEKAMPTASGDMVLTGKLSGIFAEEKGTTTPVDRFRGRIDLGAAFALSDRASLNLSGYYDGIGSNDYRAWGANLLFLLEF